MRTALVATMCNEGPYILEWVAYHRLIGFSEIVVCTNDCIDDSPALLDLLADRGLLRHLRCPTQPDGKAQLFAYRQVEALFADDWPETLMVLDADEFLNIHVGDGTVAGLIAAVPEATALLINWRIFGSSGHEHWSPEPVLERFTRAAEQQHGVNWSFKTLFRLPDAYYCPLLPHGPGHARAERVEEIRPVDGGGRPLPRRYARSEEFLQSEPGQVSWALAQVNHYNTRAWQDYLVKHRRGGGLGLDRWDRTGSWGNFDRNEEEDVSIQRHLPALRRALGTLLAEPAIRAAHERCCTRYGGHVAALAAQSA
jgi:hypothetical protein